VQAAWRGERLYDTDETKAVVRKWVSFYKAHRRILNRDVIHLRRPDGRDWDGMLHVNPGQEVCGMAMLYNPTPLGIQRRIDVPVYYTGLTNHARVKVGDGPYEVVKLTRDLHAPIPVTIGPKGVLPVLFCQGS
jgi:hypothetical protein